MDLTDPIPELSDPARGPLIQRLSELLELEQIDSPTWACLWLADVERLERLVMLAQEEPEFAYLVINSEHNTNMTKTWATRSRPKRKAETAAAWGCQAPSKASKTASAIPSPTNTPRLPRSPTRIGGPFTVINPVVRSEDARDRCEARDGGKCVVTESDDQTQIAHICPWSLGQKTRSEQIAFWNNLKLFWSETKIAEWKAALLGPSGTETCTNLICLACGVRNLWGRAQFALQPIGLSEDKKTLTVKFWWSPLAARSSRVPTEPPQTIASNQGNRTILANSRTQNIVHSGDLIEIKTEDPERHPLPSEALLQMQWVLNRVVAISGAGELSEGYVTDSDSEEEIDVEPRHMRELDEYAFELAAMYEKSAGWPTTRG